MKKLFLSVCFCLCFLQTATAAIRSVAGMEEAKKSAQNVSLDQIKRSQEEAEKYKNMTPEQMDAYLTDRLKKVVITQLDESVGFGGDGSINAQKSAAALKQEEWDKKSIFEKMYDNAMQNIINVNDPRPQAEIYTDAENIKPEAAEKIEQIQRQNAALKQAWLSQNVPTVDVPLPPSGEKTLVPALEHIPYLFSKIELLPDGLAKITDTIIVVANGNKVKKNINRIFPKFIYDRAGKRQKVDFNLLNVFVNGEPADYKVDDRNNFVVFEAQDDRLLPTGIYAFIFEYTVDNQIFSYDEFDEFYWNVTGSVWNLVVARAGAAIILPPKTKPLGQTAFTGYANYKKPDSVLITQDQNNIYGFIAKDPLFVGESMELILSLPQGTFMPASWDTKFLRFLNLYGDVLFAALGFVAILAAYLVSWKQMQKETKRKNINDPILLRFVEAGTKGNKLFGIFLLEMFKKNIVDLEKHQDEPIIIKKTDNLKSLSLSEKKALKCLFSGDEPVLRLNSFSALRVKRCAKILEKSAKIKKTMQLFKMNFSYLLFSAAMLLVAEFAIACLNYNHAYVFGFLLGATLIFCLNIWLWQKKFKSKIVNLLAKMLSVFVIGTTFFILLSVVNLATSVLIMATLIVIWQFCLLYAQKSGLLKFFHDEALRQKDIYSRQPEHWGLGRNFLLNQPLIFALDCEKFYSPNETNKNFYKLDLIDEIVSKTSA